MPTVLGLTGLIAPKQVEGADLSGRLRGGPRSTSPRPLYTESLWPELYGCCGLYGVLEGPWKYIRAPKPELYDLSRDADERTTSSGSSRKSPAGCATGWSNGRRRWLPGRSRQAARP